MANAPTNGPTINETWKVNDRRRDDAFERSLGCQVDRERPAGWRAYRSANAIHCQQQEDRQNTRWIGGGVGHHSQRGHDRDYQAGTKHMTTVEAISNGASEWR